MHEEHPELQKIEISDFSGGAVQYADLEDLAPDEVVVLENMKSVRGKLVKTFGMQADYPDTDQITDAKNLTTYIHPNLADVDPPGVDYAYIAAKVTNSILTLRVWDSTTSKWEPVAGDTPYKPLHLENAWPEFGSGYRYFHEVDKNPIIHNDGIMRLLPGNVGKVTMTNAITDVDVSLSGFEIDGAIYRHFYTPGTKFTVTGSTGNDGTYRVRVSLVAGTKLWVFVDPNVKFFTDATIDGSLSLEHPGRGVWIGYIDRDYFDKNHVADTDYDAGFYHYDAPLARPDVGQLGLKTSIKISDGCFSPRDMEAQITSISGDANTITILGAHTDQITPGSFIEVFGNSTIFGEYEVEYSSIEFDSGTPKTVIKLVADIANADNYGYVRFPSKVTPEGGTSRIGSALEVIQGPTHLDIPYNMDPKDNPNATNIRRGASRVRPEGEFSPSGVPVYRTSTTERWSPTALGEVRYYKFTYIYDGVQESLLSDPIKIQFYPTSFLSAFLPIVPATHNLRITGMNVYRSSQKDGPYAKVLHLDFLRDEEKFYSLTSATSGCTSGRRTIYIPALDGTKFPAVEDKAIQIRLKTAEMQGYGEILTCNESQIEDGILTLADGENDLVKDYWGCQAEISTDGGEEFTVYGGSFSTGTWTPTSGIYTGNKTLIFEQPLEARNYAGGVINFAHGGPGGDYDAGTFRRIDDTYKRAMHVSWSLGTEAVDEGEFVEDEESFIVTIDDGLYFTETYDDEGFGITFFDTNLPRGRGHPLEGELSIETNGAFARVVGGCLWQGNVVLDPQDKAEVHRDWICKSLPGQFDVNPASNVMRFPDREGGEITGIAELFGNVLVLKRQSIRAIDARSGSVIEVKHNIGNIAPQGYAEAADSVFVCFYDGIYRLRPNNLAPSDETPLERLRVSEAISNVYEAMTTAQKVAIKAVYDQWTNEILFAFEYTADGDDIPVVWAYNTSRGTWREVKTSSDDGHVVVPSIFALDEKAQILAYEAPADGLGGIARVYRLLESGEDVPSGSIQDGVWYYVSGDSYYVNYPYDGGNEDAYGYGYDSRSFQGTAAKGTTYTPHDKGTDGKVVACNVEAKVRIRDIAVSNERKERVRYVYITYKSGVPLTVNLYSENNTTAAETLTLPASAVTTTYKLCPDLRARKFTVEIHEAFDEDHLITAETDTDYDYLIVGKSGGVYPNTEIGRIRIYHD